MSDRPGISVVLFDCDGVLCEPLRWARKLEEIHSITRDTTRHFYRTEFAPALRGEMDVLELLRPRLKDWGWDGSAEEFLAEWLECERDTRTEVVKVVTEVKELGYYVGLATNQEKNRASFMREEMGFDELFDALFISCDVGSMKPEKEYFEKITQTLGRPGKEIVFIDDEEHYLAAAREAGWQTIQFTNVADLREKLSELGITER